MENAQNRRITIFDTTLRDGEQSPGCGMDLLQKLDTARRLQRLGVDVIEAGFPVSSPGDFDAVSIIARKVRGVTICGLARCRDGDIDRAWEALQHAEDPRIHVFLATSAIHREHKLKMSKQQIIDRAVAGVRRAAHLCGNNVEFSPEDAARTEMKFLTQVVEATIDVGATTINIPDTVGYATPDHMSHVIQTLRQRVSNIRRAVISVHCHNDLGLAVANSLASVRAGAGQVECTINGIGERAGNCSLEELVMALKTRSDIYHATTGINTRRLVPTSEEVQKITFPVARNKAVVGQNAFAHEAGIHQDGMLKEPRTYEVMKPQDVGRRRSDLILGKHSGKSAVLQHLKKYRMPVHDDDIPVLMFTYKTVADTRKSVTDAELLEEVYYPFVQSKSGRPYVVSVVPEKRRKGQPLTVKIRTRDGRTIIGEASNLEEGVIDAFVQGMQRTIPGLNIPAGGLSLTNPSEGSGGKARVTATMHNKHTVSRTVEDTDTDAAIKQAHIDAFNTLYAIEKYQKHIHGKKVV